MARTKKLILFLLCLSVWAFAAAPVERFGRVHKAMWDLWSLQPFGTGSAVCSPVSLFRSLGLLLSGTKGEAQEQIARLYGSEPPELLRTADALGARLKAVQLPGVRIWMASRLWATQSRRLQPAYLRSVRNRFNADALTVNFSRGRQTIAEMNRWANQATGGRVSNLFNAADLAGKPELILADLIAFEGRWQRPFDPQKTRSEPFQIELGNSPNRPFMHQAGTYRCLIEQKHNISGMSICEIPYKGERLGLVVVLPSVGRTLTDLEQNTKLSDLEELFRKLEASELEVALPRFRVRSRAELQAPLQQLGMTTTFVGGGDFTGMFTTSTTAKLSKVVQEVHFDVNESGTKATAATTATITRSLGGTFRADRPFLFFVRDRETGLLLFLGRYVGT